jgi:hypothetical protein
MRSVKGMVLPALMLVVALVAVASPAFATPNLTASSGATPVAPFVTPSNSTASLWTARAIAMTLASSGGIITCDSAAFSGYASTTHTQIRISSLSFGERGRCTYSDGTVDQPITCTATSANPWHLHFRNVAGAAPVNGSSPAGSAMATLNSTSTCVFRVTARGAQGTITIEPSSCTINPITYTWNIATAAASLVVACTLRVTVAIPPRAAFPTSANLTAIFNITPDPTPRNRNTIPSVTSAS